MNFKNKKIDIFSEPMSFFRKLVTTSLENQKVETSQDVEFYLVSLLVRYMQIEYLLNSQKDPLAIQYHKALLLPHKMRVQLLKDLGDVALYISGFFSDSLSRKIIDVDYYMNMGGIAYQNLSHEFPQNSLKELYKDLATKFSAYVDILAEISDQAFAHSQRDLLRLYEKWLKTKSERLEKLLKEEGLFPVESYGDNKNVN